MEYMFRSILYTHLKPTSSYQIHIVVVRLIRLPDRHQADTFTASRILTAYKPVYILNHAI
jgi:hypothetical protein